MIILGRRHMKLNWFTLSQLLHKKGPIMNTQTEYLTPRFLRALTEIWGCYPWCPKYLLASYIFSERSIYGISCLLCLKNKLLTCVFWARMSATTLNSMAAFLIISSNGPRLFYTRLNDGKVYDVMRILFWFFTLFFSAR